MPNKTCPSGHQFFKSSNCPVCPICEKENKPSAEFLALIAAPAKRALVSKNILTLFTLAKFKETEIAALHGMGPNALKKLKMALTAAGLEFNK